MSIHILGRNGFAWKSRGVSDLKRQLFIRVLASRTAHAKHFHAAREACQADVSKFCADMKPGHGRIVACLSQHTAELSDACKAQLPAPRP